MTFEELKEKINVLIDQGDSAALERFVIDHFQEFPKEIQGGLRAAFLEDSIDKQRGEAAIEQLQKEGMEAMQKIAALKAVLELPSERQNS